MPSVTLPATIGRINREVRALSGNLIHLPPPPSRAPMSRPAHRKSFARCIQVGIATWHDVIAEAVISNQ